MKFKLMTLSELFATGLPASGMMPLDGIATGAGAGIPFWKLSRLPVGKQSRQVLVGRRTELVHLLDRIVIGIVIVGKAG